MPDDTVTGDASLKVIVLDRDHGLRDHDDPERTPSGEGYLADARRRFGSPQFIHPHVFLQKGWQLANNFLPGVDEAAFAAGAIKMNTMADTKEIAKGRTVRFNKDATTDMTMVLATRDVFERALRDRLLAMHRNVKNRTGAVVTGLEHGTTGCVTGVALKDGDTLCADLVIDASGRQSKVGKWLEAGGYEAPRSVEVNPNICNYSTVFEAPQEMIDRLGWKFLYIRPQAPETRGGLCMCVEAGRMQVVSIGYGKPSMPPPGWDGMKTFMDQFGVAELSELIRHGTDLFEPQPYRGATDKRRFYEEVALPRNLVVLGDAVCVFNPSYGQGMTTAALQAEVLQRQLQARAAGSGAPLTRLQLGNLSSVAQKGIAQALTFPFQLATGEDLKYPTTKGQRSSSPASALMSKYFKAVKTCSVEDEQVAFAFEKVSHTVSPPESLFAPHVLGKVLLYRLKQLFAR